MGGWQMHTPPYSLTNNRMLGYMVRGNRDQIQKTVDAYLNKQMPDDTYYCVATGQVLIGVIEIGKLACLNLPDRDEGWLEETDVAFFITLIRLKKHGFVWLPEKLVMLPMYLMVDNPMAVMCGREVYGYPKSQGDICVPASGSTDPLSIETFVLEKFSPTTKLKKIKFFEIKHDTSTSSASDKWGSFTEMLKTIFKRAFSDLETILVEELEAAVKWEKHLLPDRIDCVFLKQFPSVANPNKACFQSIVEAPLIVTNFHGGGILPGEHQLYLEPRCDSLPVATSFGLPTGPIPIEFAFESKVDFISDVGSVVHNNMQS
jgi:hypothetical protein